MDVVNGSVATSNYQSQIFNYRTVTPTSSASALMLTPEAGVANNVLGGGWSGTLRLFSPTPSGQRSWTAFGNHYNTTGAEAEIVTMSGFLSVSAAVTGYQLQFAAGGIASCTVKLYGGL